MKRFEGFAGKGKEIIVDGEKIRIIPAVEDYAVFLSLQNGITDELAPKLVDAIVTAVKNGQKEDTIEDVKAFVGCNFGTLLTKVTIATGMATERDVQEAVDAAKAKGIKTI